MVSVITLPANVAAEKSVLGAMLIASDAAEIALGSLDENDFSNVEPRNKLIFRAMKNLQISNRPIDVQTLIDELISLHLENNVTTDYIFELVDSVITPDNVDYYVQMVKDQSVLRELLLKFGSIQEEYNKGVRDISEFIASSNDQIASICQKRTVSAMRHISEVAAEVMANIKKSGESDTKGLVGLDTGYKKLNEMTHGWRNGDFIILAARPSVGKTTLGINLAYESAKRSGRPVAFFSLEMTAEQVVEKLVARCALVPGDSITTGMLNLNEKRKVSAAISDISNTKIFFDDTPNGRLGDIISKAHKLKKQHPDLGLIVLDYLGKVKYSDQANIGQKQQEVSEISSALKTLARELDVPLICICQLNRHVEDTEGKVPSLSNLRDSGSIEADADVCMLLYRPDYYDLTGQKVGQKKGKGNEPEQSEEDAEAEKKKADRGISDVTVIVAKNRKGSVGKVHLVFQRPYSRFDDPSPEYEENLARMEAARGGFSDE
ncbi:MAG: replicative DNA helicase [Bacilli bacterium]|nr:replicative DNA helicase [Bacilli bacterium]